MAYAVSNAFFDALTNLHRSLFSAGVQTRVGAVTTVGLGADSSASGGISPALYSHFIVTFLGYQDAPAEQIFAPPNNNACALCGFCLQQFSPVKCVKRCPSASVSGLKCALCAMKDKV